MDQTASVAACFFAAQDIQNRKTNALQIAAAQPDWEWFERSLEMNGASVCPLSSSVATPIVLPAHFELGKRLYALRPLPRPAYS